MRAKFNGMRDVSAGDANAFMMTIESCNSPTHFDLTGHLTSAGKEQFWWELDELIEKFDGKKISLLPQSICIKQEVNRKMKAKFKSNFKESYHRY